MTKAQTLRLIEVTSQTQANNGTICFHDPITNCDYLSYESGYVRRKYSHRNWRGYVIPTIYQLNKTRMEPITFIDYQGKERTSEYKQRILEMNPEARMEIIYRAVVNFRNTMRIRLNQKQYENRSH